MMKIIVGAVLCLLPVLACHPAKTVDTTALNAPVHQLKNHVLKPKSPLTFRVAMAPDPVLDYLRKLDNAPQYANYMVKKQDMGQIATCLNLLPDKLKAVLQERLIGIYFISGFKGSGLTEWVKDDANRLYAFMVFNPDTLKSDLSRWLTFRENSCFKNDNPDIAIAVDCGTKYTGLLYVLMHEAVHVADYALGITPYVEELLKTLAPGRGERTAFTEGVWTGIQLPAAAYDFPLRSSLTFYGFGGGPKIPVSKAVDVYRMLEKTPFVSLYGSTSWVEDLADFAFFTHLTGVLKQPYTITIRKKGSEPYALNPVLSAAKAKNRPFPL